MDSNNLTLGQIKQLQSIFSTSNENCELIGEYVIVRCRDAGVHAGFLKSYKGREVVLLESRRLWYWKPNNNQKYLSGCAVAGLHKDSKVGAPISTLVLMDACEIISCSDVARVSISGAKIDET